MFKVYSIAMPAAVANTQALKVVVGS